MSGSVAVRTVSPQAWGEALTPAIGDAPALLHVEVEELAWPLALVAHDLAGDAVEVVEAIEPPSTEDRVDRRGGQLQSPGDVVWPPALLAADAADPLLQCAFRLRRTVPGP